MSDRDNARSRSDVEQDLAENRSTIERKLDLIEDRFSMGSVFDQVWRYAQSKSEDGTTSRLRETVARNPLPVALVGVGLAWLMLSGREGSVPSRPVAHDTHEDESTDSSLTGASASDETTHTAQSPAARLDHMRRSSRTDRSATDTAHTGRAKPDPAAPGTDTTSVTPAPAPGEPTSPTDR